MASFLTSFCTLNNFLSVKQKPDLETIKDSFCTLNNFLSVKRFFSCKLFDLSFCTLNNFLSVKPAEQDYLVGQVFLYSQ